MALPNNYYYPTGYQPYVPPMPTIAMPQQAVPQVQQTAPQPQPSNNQSNGLIWVQSEAGARTKQSSHIPPIFEEVAEMPLLFY